MSEARLDMRSVPAHVSGWNKMSFKVPSNPNRSGMSQLQIQRRRRSCSEDGRGRLGLTTGTLKVSCFGNDATPPLGMQEAKGRGDRRFVHPPGLWSHPNARQTAVHASSSFPPSPLPPCSQRRASSKRSCSHCPVFSLCIKESGCNLDSCWQPASWQQCWAWPCWRTECVGHRMARMVPLESLAVMGGQGRRVTWESQGEQH
ncbi:complement C1q subcomponent subunit A isoform X2 [Motacilla alba alba]|uniref:complement C1q subcomponent subunit A isoform X2 n=1 Tax=Motacilla alba alba TaxID=1094192 RepID=UPI0018D59AB2|nr:complement C1q subcomponent subunit A isoform X2 [Motacilla alba alba]